MAQTKGQHNFVNLKSHEDKVFLKKKKKFQNCEGSFGRLIFILFLVKILIFLGDQSFRKIK
jgi:hypothetical protein